MPTVTSAARLGIYTDAVYMSADRVAVDPVDAAFLLFAAEVGGHFAGTVVFGRTVATADTKAFVPLPDSVELVSLPHYGSLANIGAVLRSTIGSVRAFREGLQQVDVVWAFGPHPLTLVLVLLARRQRCKVVLGVRQDTPEYFRNRLGRRKRRFVLLPLAHLLDWAFRRLAQTHATTAVGEEISQRYSSGDAPVHTMVVSVVRKADVVEDAPQLTGDSPVRLLTVGRIEPEKTPFVLVDALAALQRARPGSYRLRWIGDGALAEATSAYAVEAGVADLIEFSGFVPLGRELLAAYRAATIFVHVSATEGVPQVLLEAMAAATAIVATDVGGVRMLLGDEEAGLLVPPRDPDALAAAVLRLEEAELRHRLARTGLHRIRAFTLERQAELAAAFIADSAT